MDIESGGYFGESASAFSAQYEAIPFAVVHKHWISHLPVPPGRIVDIGAGSGRDAAALADMGFNVVAVEPSPSMLEIARVNHRQANIHWINDSLPDLESLFRRAFAFDFLLLSAVWMHLDGGERVLAMQNLWKLGVPGSKAIITIRHPADFHRRMFEVATEETVALAGEVGFQVLVTLDHQDQLGRVGVTWSLLVLKHP
jgi:SAM-dependent methyltransferase